MTLGCASYKLSNLQALAGVMDEKIVYLGFDIFGLNRTKHCDMFAGWGYGEYSQKAQRIAQKHNKPFIFLEDGFLRSPFVSSLSKQPYSLVIDTKAPYYDSSVVTDLENLICKTTLSLEQRHNAQIAIDFFVNKKLGKFTIINDIDNAMLPNGFEQDSILLIDQVAGDLSLQYGQVTPEVAKYAFDFIVEAYPNKKIYLKLHPEVLAGKKKGCFDFSHKQKNVICISDIDLISLLAVKPHLFVLTSLAGFEGVLHGCPVTVFGLPWYAGYGLTNDKHSDAVTLAKRRKPVDLQTVFHCAYMIYSHYVNPISRKRTDFFTLMQHFSRIKRHIQMMRGHILAVGIRPWKRKDFYSWIKTPFNKVTFCTHEKNVLNILKGSPQTDFKIIVWNYKHSELIQKIETDYKNIKIIRVEDGFIRSYGLGSDFFPPLSLCFDNNHLYFYHTQNNKSDFHEIAQQVPFNQFFLERAKALKETIKKNNISKYNLEKITPINIKTDKYIIFVAGQVAGDASLRYGGLPDDLQNDYDLLKRVRTDYPNSYILYKPHPDVTKGNRAKGSDFDKCHEFYNQIEIDASVISCINVCDMVVILTSQTGFDALIRNKKVLCYGEAFYKNYNLCVNDSKILNSEMTLDNFIHTALVEYPLYKNGKDYITPEIAIDIIMQQKYFTKNPLRYLLIEFKLLRYLYKIKKWIIG